MKTVLRLLGVIGCCFAFCTGILVQQSVGAQNAKPEKVYFSPDVDDLFIRGVFLVQSENFKQGLELFDRIITLMPRHPLGYFLKAATYEDIQQNYRTREFDDEFDTNLDLAKKYAEELMEKDENDPVGSFFLGGSYGYQGIHDKERGKWFSAFRNGLKGLGLMEDTLKLDPEFYDCYFGLGAYHYWRVEKGRLFKFLGIFEDTRQQGIEELQLASRKGRYASFEARAALIRIFLHENRFDDALDIIRQAQKKIHNDAHMLWFKSYIYMQQGEWEKALEALDLLEGLLDAHSFASLNAYAECYYYQAVCLVELGKHELAKSKVDWIQSNWRRFRQTSATRMVLRGVRKLDV